MSQVKKEADGVHYILFFSLIIPQVIHIEKETYNTQKDDDPGYAIHSWY